MQFGMIQDRSSTPRFIPQPTHAESPRVERIVSGGQTGVDRAALDIALELGIPCGGWCPRGRLAEDGRIEDIYPLRETPSPRYAERTEWNVRDSDGTLILTSGVLSGGTALTKVVAERFGKPCLVVDLKLRKRPRSGSAASRILSAEGDRAENLDDRAPGNSRFDLVVEWLQKNTITTLNVAGPRESQRPGIHRQAVAFLRKLLQQERKKRDRSPKDR